MANTQLVWQNDGSKRFLKFVFHGHFTEEEARSVIDKWIEEFSKELPDDTKTNIIWDCLEMTGFDPKVKKIWQDILKSLSPKIADIWIISTSPVIRIAALTMGMFSKFNIKTVIKESDIK